MPPVDIPLTDRPGLLGAVVRHPSAALGAGPRGVVLV